MGGFVDGRASFVRGIRLTSGQGLDHAGEPDQRFGLRDGQDQPLPFYRSVEPSRLFLHGTVRPRCQRDCIGSGVHRVDQQISTTQPQSGDIDQCSGGRDDIAEPVFQFLGERIQRRVAVQPIKPPVQLQPNVRFRHRVSGDERAGFECKFRAPVGRNRFTTRYR